MALSVVTPPNPIMTPEDIPGSHAADDADIAAFIAAITEELDGPTGWLGRAIGEQTLKLTLPDFDCDPIWLPCPPVTAVNSVVYLDDDLVEQTVSTDVYRLSTDGYLVLKPDQSWPTPTCDQPDAVRITYAAGYSSVPERIKQAISLMVRQLKSVSDRNGSTVVSETVEGIGQFRYGLSSDASAYVQKAADNLLAGLREFR